MSSVIEVQNLSFAYTQRTIFNDLSFEIMPGVFFGIAGPNGAGKTTLLNLLCGLLRPKAGSIKIESADIESYSVKNLAQKVAVVRQEFVPVFDFTAAEIVSMSRTPYLGTFGFESKADQKIVDEALEMTDTIGFASQSLGNMSAGERQRVFIARALAQNTPILLLDEPTSFLDLKHQVGIYDLLKKMQREYGKTIIAVTHDINLTIQYADETLLLGNDSSFHIGKAEDVFTPEQIETIFGVKTFVGRLGQEKFFIPLGKFAKDGGVTAPSPTEVNRNNGGSL